MTDRLIPYVYIVSFEDNWWVSYKAVTDNNCVFPTLEMAQAWACESKDEEIGWIEGGFGPIEGVRWWTGTYEIWGVDVFVKIYRCPVMQPVRRERA